jgi:CheY-like chemotaxis protein
MPGGTGTTLASDLRRGQPHVKVLFTSGYPDHPEGDPGDCKDFLAKPFRPRELALAVRRLIDADPAPHDRPAVA